MMKTNAAVRRQQELEIENITRGVLGDASDDDDEESGYSEEGEEEDMEEGEEELGEESELSESDQA